MTQIGSEERQNAKAAAANLAVAANDAAVALGAFGAAAAIGLTLTGVGAGAGLGVGAALAVSSFGAWYIGNRYQRLANDPPRTDFDIVTISAASSAESGQSTEDLEVAARLFAVHQILLADALDCLVTSLERYDGAIESEDFDAAQNQADAVRQNAFIVQSAQAVVLDCLIVLNAAWVATELEWSSLQIDDVKSIYLESAGPPHQAPGEALQSLLDGIIGLDSERTFTDLDGEADPILSLSELPPRPDALVEPAFAHAMSELSATLGLLVNDDDTVS